MVFGPVSNAAELFESVQDTQVLTVVGFFEEKCVLCEQSSDRFHRLSLKHANVKFVKVLALEAIEACQKWGVRMAPTFLFFSYQPDGPEEERVVGGDLPKVEKIIKNFLANESLLLEHAHELQLPRVTEPKPEPESEPKPEPVVRVTETETSLHEHVSQTLESPEAVNVAATNLTVSELANKQQAYVTLATSDEYVVGALVLAHSLRRTATERQLVCLTAKNVALELRELLSGTFDRVVEVDILNSNDDANLQLLGRPELACTFTKLHCWRLTEYNKCVFLDADVLVLNNIDELFERDELTACRDAGWPDYFNSGVFVFVPKIETYKALVEFAVSHGSFDGGDQGLLNRYFADWGFGDIRKHLPFIFNCTAVYLNSCYSYVPALVENMNNIHVLHFAGAANKPWHFRYDANRDDIVVPGSEIYASFARYWWYLLASHVHKSLGLAVRSAEHNVSKLDELVRRIAATPFRENSQLLVGARLHPHIALRSVRPEQRQEPAGPHTSTVSAEAPSSSHYTQPQEHKPHEEKSHEEKPHEEKPHEEHGSRTFSDIERKLRQAFHM